MKPSLKLAPLFLLVSATFACGSSDASSDDGDDSVSEDGAELSAKAMWVGMNSATNENPTRGDNQFAYFAAFNTLYNNQSGPNSCHTYVNWNAADGDTGTANDPGSLKSFQEWIAAAKTEWTAGGKTQHYCNNAVITFKGNGNGATPTTSQYKAAVTKFIETNWGFPGVMDYTAFNEPDNAQGAGNGLHDVLTPGQAADYYLALRSVCATHHCNVSAGDLGTNGHPIDSSSTQTPLVPYMEELLADISEHAPQFGLPANFQPEFFSFHPWADVNAYIDHKTGCTSASTCTMDAVLAVLAKAAPKAKVWLTEVGAGQNGKAPDTFNDAATSDHDRMCAVKFLMRISGHPQVTRLYYTRMHGGPGTLFNGGTPSSTVKELTKFAMQSANALAERAQSAEGC